MEQEGSPQFRIVTQEGAIVMADVRLADMSSVLDFYRDKDEVSLPEVTEPMLHLVMEYCHRQRYVQPRPIRKPLSSDRIEDAVTEPWHAEFINALSEETLNDLAMAANYLDVKGLLELCYAKIATLFKGKTVEELKERYNITEDLTPEMEERILKENPWITSDSDSATVNNL